MKLDQSNQAKAEFTSPLYELLRTDRNKWWTYDELTDRLHCSRRSVRNELSKVAMYHPIQFSSSDGRGFKLGRDTRHEVMTFVDLKNEYDNDCIALGELQSRITILQAREKSLIAHKVKMEEAMARFDSNTNLFNFERMS